MSLDIGSQCRFTCMGISSDRSSTYFYVYYKKFVENVNVMLLRLITK